MIGLCPMAFGGANAAGVYYYTLAETIIGWLAVSTLLTLIVLPALFYVLSPRAAKAEERLLESNTL